MLEGGKDPDTDLRGPKTYGTYGIGFTKSDAVKVYPGWKNVPANPILTKGDAVNVYPGRQDIPAVPILTKGDAGVQ